MSRYLPEPVHQANRTGILLINLGTPTAPTPGAVRDYLREFLSDPRVIELPRLLWWFILHGIVLRIRPAKSAKKYSKIWIDGTEGGSPLAKYTRDLAAALQQYIDNRKDAKAPKSVTVSWAMRYAGESIERSIRQQIMALKEADCGKLLIVPLYPQYAAASTGSVFDAVADTIKQLRNPPEIRFVKDFHDHPAYIETLANRIQAQWDWPSPGQGRGKHLLMSFHGLPQATVKLGDPYYQQCHTTGRLLAMRLGLQDEDYTVTFQSRFGTAKWLQPSTQKVLQTLGNKKMVLLDVVCPGFVADCLETLEEIMIEGAADFEKAGGGTLRYIPAMNAEKDWVAAMGKIVASHWSHW